MLWFNLHGARTVARKTACLTFIQGADHRIVVFCDIHPKIAFPKLNFFQLPRSGSVLKKHFSNAPLAQQNDCLILLCRK